MSHKAPPPPGQPEQPQKDCWDKAEIIGKGVFAVLGIAVAICFDDTIKMREVNLELVEVAVGVLKNKPVPDMTELREWSIVVVNKYSGVPFSEKAKAELRHNALPAYLTTEKGEVITDEKGNALLP